TFASSRVLGRRPLRPFQAGAQHALALSARMLLRLALRAYGACDRPHTQLSSTTTLAELHHETLDTGSPHRRRSCDLIPCVRGRQDYRSGPRRLRRWFRMETGGGHPPESWLLGTSCPGA